MRISKIFIAFTFLATVLTGCSHAPEIKEIALQGPAFEYFEFPFSEEIADSLILVKIGFPQGENAIHKTVPWAAGNRTRVGYSYAEDSVYFAVCFSQDIKSEDGDVYTFRRKFSPNLRVIVGRSDNHVSEAVTILYSKLDTLYGVHSPNNNE